MDTTRTRPTTTRPAASPAPDNFFSSPLFFGLHAALTVGLLLALVVVGSLARFGAPVPADDTATDKPDSPDRTTPATAGEKQKEGRYQIELADDARNVLNEARLWNVYGAGGVREAWVYRYKGGLLERKLETDVGEARVVPSEWTGLLHDDEDIKEGKADALNKEGYIVLLGMVPVVSVDEALAPLSPHLGAMFTTGPAGLLHGLVPYYHEVWRRREYRLYLTATPPKDKPGRGFTAPSRHPLLIRSHFLNDETRPELEPAHSSGGKDIEAGKEVTILERQRALSTIRLKARFLTDKEAIEKAKATPQEKE